MRASEAERGTGTGEALSNFQATDLTREFRYKSGISGNRPLRCERVNDFTFKISDGEMSRVPAKLGWWGGYNTPRALAWVINVGINSAAWIARCDDKVSGPFPLNEAKATAIRLVKGAEGDYRIQRPISHLQGLQARLLDRWWQFVPKQMEIDDLRSHRKAEDLSDDELATIALQPESNGHLHADG